MALEKHYRIDYCLHGASKFLYVRSATMDNAQAWNWAAMDAGITGIPKPRQRAAATVSKPMAEKFGVSEVTWSLT